MSFKDWDAGRCFVWKWQWKPCHDSWAQHSIPQASWHQCWGILCLCQERKTAHWPTLGDGTMVAVALSWLGTISLRLPDINAEGYYAYVKKGTTAQWPTLGDSSYENLVMTQRSILLSSWHQDSGILCSDQDRVNYMSYSVEQKPHLSISRYLYLIISMLG